MKFSQIYSLFLFIYIGFLFVRCTDQREQYNNKERGLYFNKPYAYHPKDNPPMSSYKNQIQPFAQSSNEQKSLSLNLPIEYKSGQMNPQSTEDKNQMKITFNSTQYNDYNDFKIQFIPSSFEEKSLTKNELEKKVYRNVIFRDPESQKKTLSTIWSLDKKKLYEIHFHPMYQGTIKNFPEFYTSSSDKEMRINTVLSNLNIQETESRENFIKTLYKAYEDQEEENCLVKKDDSIGPLCKIEVFQNGSYIFSLPYMHLIIGPSTEGPLLTEVRLFDPKFYSNPPPPFSLNYDMIKTEMTHLNTSSENVSFIWNEVTDSSNLFDFFNHGIFDEKISLKDEEFYNYDFPQGLGFQFGFDINETNEIVPTGPLRKITFNQHFPGNFLINGKYILVSKDPEDKGSIEFIDPKTYRIFELATKFLSITNDQFDEIANFFVNDQFNVAKWYSDTKIKEKIDELATLFNELSGEVLVKKDPRNFSSPMVFAVNTIMSRVYRDPLNKNYYEQVFIPAIQNLITKTNLTLTFFKEEHQKIQNINQALIDILAQLKTGLYSSFKGKDFENTKNFISFLNLLKTIDQPKDATSWRLNILSLLEDRLKTLKTSLDGAIGTELNLPPYHKILIFDWIDNEPIELPLDHFFDQFTQSLPSRLESLKTNLQFLSDALVYIDRTKKQFRVPESSFERGVSLDQIQNKEEETLDLLKEIREIFRKTLNHIKEVPYAITYNQEIFNSFFNSYSTFLKENRNLALLFASAYETLTAQNQREIEDIQFNPDLLEENDQKVYSQILIGQKFLFNLNSKNEFSDMNLQINFLESLSNALIENKENISAFENAQVLKALDPKIDKSLNSLTLLFLDNDSTNIKPPVKFYKFVLNFFNKIGSHYSKVKDIELKYELVTDPQSFHAHWISTQIQNNSFKIKTNFKDIISGELQTFKNFGEEKFGLGTTIKIKKFFKVGDTPYAELELNTTDQNNERKSFRILSSIEQTYFPNSGFKGESHEQDILVLKLKIGETTIFVNINENPLNTEFNAEIIGIENKFYAFENQTGSFKGGLNISIEPLGNQEEPPNLLLKTGDNIQSTCPLLNYLTFNSFNCEQLPPRAQASGLKKFEGGIQGFFPTKDEKQYGWKIKSKNGQLSQFLIYDEKKIKYQILPQDERNKHFLISVSLE